TARRRGRRQAASPHQAGPHRVRGQPGSRASARGAHRGRGRHHRQPHPPVLQRAERGAVAAGARPARRRGDGRGTGYRGGRRPGAHPGAVHDRWIVNSAVVAPVRLDLRTRAAVVVDFALDQLATDGDDDEDVLDFLDEDCEQVEAADGARRWSLKDGRRVDTLGRVPIERLRAARERAVAGTGVLQQMLDRSLGPGWDPDALDVLSAEEARALGVVARWWDGGHAAVPRESRVRTLVGRLSLFDDLRT